MTNDNFFFFLNYPKLKIERDTSGGNGVIVCKGGNKGWKNGLRRKRLNFAISPDTQMTTPGLLVI
jgi:hypothetical protein